jgi:hypothetical protein
MYRGIIGTLLGAVLWMLGVQGSNAEWYKVPAGGQVTFTLTEQWAIVKQWGIATGTPPNTFVLGDATIVLEYVDGSTEQITFQESGGVVSGLVAPESGSALSVGTGSGEFSGTNVWTQTASLMAGREFQIVSATPAQSYAQDVEFQGGTGALLRVLLAASRRMLLPSHNLQGQPRPRMFLRLSSWRRACKHSRRHCFRSIRSRKSNCLLECDFDGWDCRLREKWYIPIDFVRLESGA